MCDESGGRVGGCCDHGAGEGRRLTHCDCGEALPRRFLRPFLLLLLSEGASHGYELARSLTGDGLDVEPSILYRALHRMEEEGLATSALDDSGTGPARKVYELTAEGREALDLWASSLAGTADMLASFSERYGRTRGIGRA